MRKVTSSARRGFHVTGRGYVSIRNEAAPLFFGGAVNLGGNTIDSSQNESVVFFCQKF